MLRQDASHAAALLNEHVDCVNRTGSAGTESGSRARSLVLLTMLAPVSRSARFSQYIGWGIRARWGSRRRIELGNRRRRCHGQLPSAWHLCRRFTSF